MRVGERVALRELLVALESGSRPKGGVKGIESGVPSLGGEHLDANGGFRLDRVRYVPREFAASMRRGKIAVGDVLVVKDGATTGKVALVRDSFPHKDAVVNEHVFLCRCDERVDPRYVFWYLYSAEGQREILSDFRGAAQGGISQRFADLVQVPLRPIGEQRRIVAEIEKQFSRLDEAVAKLKRVKANLKNYKAAVLKAAAEGKLVPTEAELARRAGQSFETGGQLLTRLLERRKSQWKGKGKYAEPCPPDTTDLPPLPDGWTYATAEQLTDPNRTITYGVIKLGAPVDGGVPVLRSSDVRSLRIDLEGVKTIAPSIAAEYRRTFLEGGEVVITVRGTLGGIAVAPSACRGFNVSREVAMLAMVEPELAHAMAQFIAAAPIQKWLMTRTKGIAYTGINIETLKALPLPVPPLHEQRRICAETERLLSMGAELELEIESNMLRAQGLSQASLEQALMGGF